MRSVLPAVANDADHDAAVPYCELMIYNGSAVDSAHAVALACLLADLKGLKNLKEPEKC